MATETNKLAMGWRERTFTELLRDRLDASRVAAVGAKMDCNFLSELDHLQTQVRETLKQDDANRREDEAREEAAQLAAEAEGETAPDDDQYKRQIEARLVRDAEGKEAAK